MNDHVGVIRNQGGRASNRGFLRVSSKSTARLRGNHFAYQLCASLP